MVANKQVIFAEIPEGFPVPGKTLVLKTSQLDTDTVALNGGVLTKTIALSHDPFQRGLMGKASSYSSAFEIGKPIFGIVVAEIIRSEASDYPVGTYIMGMGNFEEYSIFSGPEELAARLFRATAFWSYKEIGKPKKGETIFVSSGAGAVGSVVVQLAKIDGLKVIASAGSPEKVEFLKSVGVDVAFNYKTDSTLKVLEANPLDIYFDNVGGEVLDAALATLKPFGRIVACGSISQYNLKPEDKYQLKNWQSVVGKELTYQGFLLPGKDLSKFYATVPGLIKSGELKVKEHVTHGLDDGQAFVDMLTGKTEGKTVISLE